jgi:hypothetical protein
MAAETRRYEAAMRLPLVLAEYLGWRRLFDDMLVTSAVSLDAARRLGDRGNEASALTTLGLALKDVRRLCAVRRFVVSPTQSG